MGLDGEYTWSTRQDTSNLDDSGTYLYWSVVETEPNRTEQDIKASLKIRRIFDDASALTTSLPDVADARVAASMN